MTTIPERIREEAREWAEHLDCNQERATSVISKALLAAEKRGREEAAKIADAHAECERDCGDVIAAAIRSGN